MQLHLVQYHPPPPTKRRSARISEKSQPKTKVQTTAKKPRIIRTKKKNDQGEAPAKDSDLSDHDNSLAGKKKDQEQENTALAGDSVSGGTCHSSDQNRENSNIVNSVDSINKITASTFMHRKSYKTETFHIQNSGCVACSRGYRSLYYLKQHLSWSHYGSKLLKTFCPTGDLTKCDLCGKTFGDTSLNGQRQRGYKLVAHLGLKHDKLLDVAPPEIGIRLMFLSELNEKGVPELLKIVRNQTDIK